MNHAPGPWKLFPRNDNQFEVVDSDQARVAIVSPGVDAKESARLIAAAPELLAALKEFVAMFIDTKLYPDPETIVTGLRIFLPNARAAIRKAEGK